MLLLTFMRSRRLPSHPHEGKIWVEEIGYSASSRTIKKRSCPSIYEGDRDTVMVDISAPGSTAAYLVSVGA